MKSVAVALSKAAVTAILLFVLFRKLDLQQFGATLRNADWGILLLGFLILWGAHVVCTSRWRVLMRPVMPVPSPLNLFGIYCIGLFWNLAFPTAVGGDVVKIYYAGKPSKRFAQSLAAGFLDRDAGMLAMMAIACAATLYRGVAIPGIPVRAIIWGVSAAFLAANVVVFTPALHALFTSILDRFGLARIARKIDAVSGAFQILGQNPAVLAVALLISLANQLLVISVTWVLALGLHLNASPVYFLLFVPVVTLISMIPVSFNGMGLREYAVVSLFGAIGVDREACMALGLLSSAIIIISAIPGAIIYIFFRTRNDAEQIAALDSSSP